MKYVMAKNSWIIGISLFLSISLQAQKQEVKLVQTFNQQQGKVECLTFSKDGKWLAAGGRAGIIPIWDMQTKQYVQSLKEHRSTIHHVAFNKQGNLLASASEDGTAKLWNVTTGAELQSWLNPPRQRFRATYFIVFSPDEQKLYFGGSNAKIAEVNIGSTDKPKTVYESLFHITCGVLSPDEQYLVVGTGESIHFIDLQTFKKVYSLTELGAYVNDIQFSNKGNQLSAWTEDGHLHVWNYPNRTLIRKFKAGDEDYGHIAYSTNDDWMVTGSQKHVFTVWDTQQHRSLGMGTQHEAVVKAFACSPIEPLIVTASYDRTVRFWELKEVIPEPVTPPKVAPKPPTLPVVQQKTTPKPTPPKITVPPLVPAISPKPTLSILNNRRIKNKAMVKVSQPTIEFVVWDDEDVDGDVISLYLNGECILKEHPLNEHKKQLKVELAPNQLNSLALYAHNMGKQPPNTAAIQLNNGSFSKKINLAANLEVCEAVHIWYEE